MMSSAPKAELGTQWSPDEYHQVHERRGPGIDRAASSRGSFFLSREVGQKEGLSTKCQVLAFLCEAQADDLHSE